MVDFAELKNRITPQLESDLFMQFTEASGSSLNEAVLEAAALLRLPVRRIVYEVVERGTAGFLGKGAKPWKIKAYPGPSEAGRRKAAAATALELADEAEVEIEIPNVDGDVFVQLRKGDVFLKVTAAAGKGKPVTEADVDAALKRRRILEYDKTLAAQAVKNADGTYARMCGFQHNAANDSFARVEISENEMHAYIYVTPPGLDGSDVSLEGYQALLRSNGVVYGINESFLEQFADRPVYGSRICVAEGKPAVNGKDARMEFFFEANASATRLKETDMGAINFKELNIIQNVMTGDKLALKLPPEKGEHGQTVKGTLLPATDGKDVPLALGNNVSVEKDGLTVIASENGQVVLNGGKISVEKIYTVDGSVGVKTGNILFLGSVMVNGDVEEGYSIKATGNIEVVGLVDKAELQSDGDIIVRQGITGKQGVTVRAGQTIIAKFIENATVRSGGAVIVSEGILNSAVSARQQVVCRGKKAAIVGGKICAGEEIQSKILGSASGNTQTICEVGYDPETKEELAELTAKREAAQKELDEFQRNITTLETMKQRQKTLSEDKETYLADLLAKREAVIAQLEGMQEKTRDAEARLAQVQTKGKVAVSTKCYPGSVICVRDARTTVTTEYKSVMFTLLDGLIHIGKFTEADGDAAKKEARG
ncbi:MAG: FapA family protein [Spirochaetaceae bacterium]|jgi:uncharacterized protein (DUF342 family)|nr:FapA family protein [Spirochaetaceae bacterium]